MKRHNLLMVVSASVSCAFVVLTVVLVRGLGEDAYAKYVGRGGEKGFWPWFARDLCGVPIPGVEAEADETGVKRQMAEAAALARAAEVAREQARIEAAKREKAERKARAKEAARKAKAAARNESAKTKKNRHAKSKKRGGHSINTGGASSFTAGSGKSPYRVNGIRGIEFGSSDNAPAEGAKPVMSVTYDDDGNMEFRGLKWKETKKLTESVYGFDKAELVHSYDTEQLSMVSFTKSFPFTEEGLRQATEFYKTMSAEASADLGFEVINVDKTDNLKSATVCEFKNADSDTSIRGAISAWSDKSLTVSFSVTDKAYAQETRAQSSAAYESGVADAVDARIEDVGNRDHTAQKERINAYLGK